MSYLGGTYLPEYTTFKSQKSAVLIFFLRNPKLLKYSFASYSLLLLIFTTALHGKKINNLYFPDSVIFREIDGTEMSQKTDSFG